MQREQLAAEHQQDKTHFHTKVLEQKLIPVYKFLGRIDLEVL